LLSNNIEVVGKRSPSNAPELGENAITLLAMKLAEQQGIPPKTQSYFQWISEHFHQKHFGEGINLALSDTDSGNLILTPIVLQNLQKGSF
jgi:succinyl-diaminopimelate desuccinylase